MATALGEPDVLRLLDVPNPEIGEGQVLIRTQTASVNFADIKARKGQYHGGSKPPFIPGLDCAGIIEAVGPGVLHLSEGMRVAAFPIGGSYAQYVAADQRLVFPLPAHIDWETAAALPTVGLTAYALLARVAEVKAGESVLIHAAAGGVGTTAVQLARILGASQIVGVVGHPDKIDLVKKLGADHVIDSSSQELVQAVKNLTGGRGVDVVLDSIGGKVSEDSLTCTARYGRLVHFGSSSGEAGYIAVGDLHASCRSVRGFSLGTTRAHRPEEIAPLAEAVLDLAERGLLTMQIGHRYPLNQASAAHRLMESRASTGKIILDTVLP